MSDPAEENPYASAQTVEASPSKTRLRWYFLAGMLFTFLVVLFFWHAYVFAGRGIMAIPLAQFYWIELKMALTTTSSLGPDSPSPLWLVLPVHLMVSAVGGAIVAGTVWCYRKLRA